MANSQHESVPAVALLDDWIKKKRLSVPQFAKMIKREGQLVHAWRYRRANPNTLDVLAIHELTGIAPHKWLTRAQQRRLNTIRENFAAEQIKKAQEDSE